MKSTVLRALVATAVMTSACGKKHPEESNFPTKQPNQPLDQQSALVAFPDCGQLEQYIKDTAVREMREQLETNKQWDIKYPIGHWGGAIDAGTAEGGNTSGPTAFTKTNVQVAGVDEADIVKTDGKRIFTLAGRQLHLSLSWPANQLQTIHTVEIEGFPYEMFLEERNRLIIFSSSWVNDWITGTCRFPGCGVLSNATKVTVLDVTDLMKPKSVGEYFLPGQYTHSRRVGPSIRVVTNDLLHWPSGVQPYIDDAPLGQTRTADEITRAYDTLMVQNETQIRAQPLSAWLPTSRFRTENGTLFSRPYSCSDFSAPKGSTRLGITNVSTINLDSQGLSQTSILANYGQVYASATALYVTNPEVWQQQPGQSDYTYVHKFDISDPGQSKYVASGTVPGLPLNSFSLDEYQDHLRVATTITTRGELGQRSTTVTQMNVLKQMGAALKIVGTTDALAPGERIFSARFMGPRAFVVTFRQVDPLFTFDLSNPQAPQKVGELKVPGFSSYIHPLDDSHLLTLGIQTPEPPTSAETRALKLSIFDVSDLANPRETATQIVGSWSSYSEALWQHKAFNYFPERKLLAIPFTDWEWNSSNYWESFISELRVFSIDTNAISPKGALSMRDLYVNSGNSYWSWYWVPYIRRSIIADDFVYAISDVGIRVAHTSSPSSPVATSVFPAPKK